MPWTYPIDVKYLENALRTLKSFCYPSVVLKYGSTLGKVLGISLSI